MELGYTPPLQKQLKVELPPSKPPIGPFFCWAVHTLTVQGRKAVLAMNRDTLAPPQPNAPLDTAAPDGTASAIPPLQLLHFF